MLTKNIWKGARFVTLGLLATGSIVYSLPVSAYDISTNAQDLAGIDSKTTSDWPWQVGYGEDTDAFIYERSYNPDDFFNRTLLQPRSEDWRNLNTGEGARGTATFKVIRF